MAKISKKATVKKVAETKVIRRRNEKNEVVEIEVPIEAVKPAEMKVMGDLRGELMKRKKHVSGQLVQLSKERGVGKKRKAALEAIDRAIAKRLASI